MMQADQHLSIVIPTYNRSEFLDHCLQVHIPLAKTYNIRIFVFDNASTDATAEVVRNRIKEYPLIDYHCNESNIGPDRNFERALKYPETDYVWLLGDTYQISAEMLDYFYDVVPAREKTYDVIVFNVINRVCDVPRQDYSDQNKLLSDLGWHMTCLASLVYNSQLIAKADFERYRDTNFLQTGIIFEYIARKRFLIHWVETLSVQPISLKDVAKESWLNQTFEIWVRRWANFIFSLPPSYDLDTKMKCIKNHGIKSGLFSLRGLLVFRKLNILNYETYKKISNFISFSIDYPKTVVHLICLLPRRIARIVKNFV
ncbi:MAG: glycosyltransferase [Geobacteraceae bacterium]|nr:glycosyltransferase [Geobacteraceae bacterium]